MQHLWGGGIEIGHDANPMILNNVLDKNSTGILFWFSTSSGEVKGNLITRNRYGVYVKDFDTVVFSGNNFKDNQEYNICNMCSLHAIEAKNNWWDTTLPVSIEQSIYDGRKKEGLGWVVYYPIADNETQVALLAPPPFLANGFLPASFQNVASPQPISQILLKPTPFVPYLGSTGSTVEPTPVPPPVPSTKEQETQGQEDNGPWKSKW